MRFKIPNSIDKLDINIKYINIFFTPKRNKNIGMHV